MTGKDSLESIHLSALDSVVYGAARAFDYLGERGQEMLDKVGDGIVDYCYEKSYIKRSNDPQQLGFELVNFFKNNGYVGNVELSPQGETMTVTMQGWRFMPLLKKLRNRDCYLLTCPLCLANNSILRANALGWKRLDEDVKPDGSYSVKVKLGSSSAAGPVPLRPANMNIVKEEDHADTKVGLPAFEAMEYGLARAFEYLGAQAEILLENVGRGIIEFLQDEFRLKLDQQYADSMQTLSSFYVSRGLSDKIDIGLSGSEVKFEFKNYRYSPVLKLLIAEGHPLTSCPFVLAARGTFRAAGIVGSDMTWTLGSGRDATLVMKLQKISDQVFDEEKVARLMESA